MNPNVVGKVVGKGAEAKHDLPAEVLEDLPRQLCSPVAVLTSATRPHDSLVILTHHTVDELPVIAALQVDIGSRRTAHKITSLYTKGASDIDFLRRWVSEGRCLYAIKKDLEGVAFIPTSGAGSNPRWHPSKPLPENITTKATLVNKYRFNNRFRVYIAGQNPVDPRNRELYALAERRLAERGFRPVNPSGSPRPAYSLLQSSNAVALLPGPRCLVEGFTVQELAAALEIPVVKDFKSFMPKHVMERRKDIPDKTVISAIRLDNPILKIRPPFTTAQASLSATVTDSAGAAMDKEGVAFSLEDPSLAELLPAVGNKAFVTSARPGQTRIIATSLTDPSIRSECRLFIEGSLTGLNLSPKSFTLAAGDSMTVVPAFVPADAIGTGLTWTSSAPDIATVDGGLVMARNSSGTATITATSMDWPGVFATATAHVTKETDTSVLKILLSDTYINIPHTADEPYPLTATVYDTSSKAIQRKVTFSVPDSGVVETRPVGNTLMISPANSGSVRITATVDAAPDVTAECVVDVGAAAQGNDLRRLIPDSPNLSLRPGTEANVSVFFVPAGTKQNAIRWSSSENAVATVAQKDNGEATVTAMTVGKATITARSLVHLISLLQYL